MLMDNELRPCHIQGCKPNAGAAAHFDRVVHNHAHLHGAWEG